MHPMYNLQNGWGGAPGSRGCQAGQKAPEEAAQAGKEGVVFGLRSPSIAFRAGIRITNLPVKSFSESFLFDSLSILRGSLWCRCSDCRPEKSASSKAASERL